MPLSYSPPKQVCSAYSSAAARLVCQNLYGSGAVAVTNS
jgi:hypothetical protein